MKIENKKRIAIMLVAMIIINLFLPYTMIKKTYAVSSVAPTPTFVMKRTSEILTHATNGRYFTADIAIVGDVHVTTFDFKIGFDKTKIEAGNKSTIAPAAALNLATNANPDIYINTNYAVNTSYLNVAEGSFRYVGAATQKINPATDWETYGLEPGYMRVYTLTFRVIDPAITSADDLTTDMFTFMPNGVLLTGFKMGYADELDNRYYPTDTNYFQFQNFATPAATPTGIDITTQPAKTTYNHGENIDLTGGKITVTYDDLSTADIDLTDPDVTITGGSPAAVGNNTVTISYKGFTDTFNITVNDPVNSIALTTNPTKTTYLQDEAIDLTGGVVTVTTASGATSTINLPNAGVTCDTTGADLLSPNIVGALGVNANNLPTGTQKITLTHDGKQTDYNITVNDVVESMSVSGAKTTYKYNENLDLSTGLVTPVLKSGINTVNANLSDGAKVSVTGYNKTTLGNQTLTVNAFGTSTTYQVNVEDYIVGINVTSPTKVTYQFNEDLDLAGISGVTTMASGAAGSSITINAGMITGYNKTVLGLQTLTVTYTTTNTIDNTSMNFTDTFNVTVEDYITSVNIGAPTKSIYNHGDTLDLTGGTITENYASGATVNVPMTAGMITELNDSPVVMSPGSYDGTNKLDKTLKITYGGTTQNYPITIVNDVKSIAVTTSPKTVYNVNEALDVTGGVITVTRAVGTNTVTLTSGMVTGFTTATEATGRTLTVSYTENSITKTTTYNIDVIDSVTGFIIKTTPKIDYKYGEALDVAGGVITVTRGSGDSDTAITSGMISGYNPNVLGPQTLTVTYSGFTKTYEVNVTDYITGVTVTQPTKVDYKYNEDLDLTGGLVTTVMASGAAGSSVAITSGMVTGYSKTIVGNQTLTVTYTTTNTIDGLSADFTGTFNVNVQDYVVGINVTAPTKVIYQYGESLDLTGASGIEEMASGALGNPIVVTSGMVSGYNPNTLGTQTLTVTYTTTNTIDDLSSDFTDTFDVTVEDYVANIAITEPTKSVYNHGESLDLTGGTIVETMASGAVNNITMTAGMITETDDSPVVMNPGSYDGTNKLDKTLKITYGGTDQNYPITIINDVKSIAVTSTPKTDYNVNDLLDVTGGQITITRAVGTSVETITSGMVTGFDSSVEASNMPLTVTYTENGITQNTTYNINIVDSVIGFTISTSPKISYNYGEVLDVTGGKLTVTRGSGDTIIDLTSGMV
ncbi:MAG TPA: bacterial Ig-like domain-containing protein, partial [Clostridia bacterium]|nr:bacterial Ig-like domain-containing protein [Clostridia bacterium]